MPKKASPKPKKPTTNKPDIQIKSKKKREGHLNKEEYLVIIEWLKIERNYNSCFGTGKAPAVGHQAKDKYRKFLTKSISTGFGLTNEDQKAEISTIDEKLESICPHYHVINELMGGQAFINPCFKVDAQADNKTATSPPSEPAGNEIRSSDMERNNDYVCISTSS
ncbi:hypothetical protein VP01_622g2 [Puccinia sorghi]|uniref:Uncharacterized protein n=1 Tax=Puccinia sorghi TaxID=27349 RepID=A0A0L6UGK0_9BASI|nr:hypothetical protein VP01_622g2 [Puccinia sorghi]